MKRKIFALLLVLCLLAGLLSGGRIAVGGQTDPEGLRIAPTVLVDVPEGSPVLEEEIFGPILPVLLYRSLPELVEAAQWFVTRLNTNGRLLTPELCRRLFEASLDSVQVTLYAARREVHNALVGAEGFDDTVQGIRNAAAAGLIVSVNTPLCSLNRDYAETLRFVHGLGVRYVTCSGLIPTGSAAGEESRATRLSQEELTDILRQAAETAHGLGMELDFTSPGWLPEEALRDMGLHLIPSCGACLSNMALAPDGTVLPCQSWLEGPGLGNLLTDDWSGIWDGEPCRRIRAESAKMEHICQLRQEGGC